jgi:hypothetical protein
VASYEKKNRPCLYCNNKNFEVKFLSTGGWRKRDIRNLPHLAASLVAEARIQRIARLDDRPPKGHVGRSEGDDGVHVVLSSDSTPVAPLRFGAGSPTAGID